MQFAIQGKTHHCSTLFTLPPPSSILSIESVIMGKKNKNNDNRKLVSCQGAKETVFDLPAQERQSSQAPKATPRSRLRIGNNAQATISGIVTPGQILAERYKVVQELGSGGMGMVYKATDAKLEDRVCAIKVLPPDLAKEEAAVTRLRREALAAIELHHSNIMAVHSFDSDGDVSFIVMEYLDGPNLDVAIADRGKLPLAEVIQIANQVCPALDFANERGVIHRDIKPANLMFKSVNDKQVVKITDFGIAYQIRESTGRLTRIIHDMHNWDINCSPFQFS